MIVEKALFEARANELMQYVDSFGTNHTIETGMIPVMTLHLPYDANRDHYPFEEDLVEPKALAMDAWSDPRVKPVVEFELDNLVDTNFVQLPKDERAKAAAEHASRRIATS